MPNLANRSSPETQKAMRCKIHDLIQEKLSGDVLKDFEAFLDFLKEEKINTPWERFGYEGIHTFCIKHKGQHIGQIGFLNDENHVRIQVIAEWSNFDSYVEGQPVEVIDMLMERLSYTCIHCRPGWDCEKNSGWTRKLAGKQYENRCSHMSTYRFISGDMNTFTLYTPIFRQPQESVGEFPLETVKKLILARKAYIAKTAAK